MAVVTEQGLAVKEPLKLWIATGSLARHVALLRTHPPQGYHAPVMLQTSVETTGLERRCRARLTTEHTIALTAFRVPAASSE
eukprot:4798339-Pyramimonas_sp.AAC.1